jgi:hypothetical protein
MAQNDASTEPEDSTLNIDTLLKESKLMNNKPESVNKYQEQIDNIDIDSIDSIRSESSSGGENNMMMSKIFLDVNRKADEVQTRESYSGSDSLNETVIVDPIKIRKEIIDEEELISTSISSNLSSNTTYSLKSSQHQSRSVDKLDFQTARSENISELNNVIIDAKDKYVKDTMESTAFKTLNYEFKMDDVNVILSNLDYESLSVYLEKEYIPHASNVIFLMSRFAFYCNPLKFFNNFITVLKTKIRTILTNPFQKSVKFYSYWISNLHQLLIYIKRDGSSLNAATMEFQLDLTEYLNMVYSLLLYLIEDGNLVFPYNLILESHSKLIAYFFKCSFRDAV